MSSYARGVDQACIDYKLNTFDWMLYHGIFEVNRGYRAQWKAMEVLEHYPNARAILAEHGLNRFPLPAGTPR